VGRLRSWINRLSRDAEDEAVVIPQQDGSIQRFSKDAAAEAFVHEANRVRAIYRGEDPAPAHPLTVARRNALHPEDYAGAFDADRQPRRTGSHGV
jgi:hypothetical protein